jgi:alanine transaminase
VRTRCTPPESHPFSLYLQIGVDLLVDPPKPGDASYELWHEETSATQQGLKDRSAYMSERFNALPGMSCQPAEGAMYLFPQIEMPEKAVAKAKEAGKPADVMYALELLGTCLIGRARKGAGVARG